jgi:protein-L-isoaspartate(D-aspartate) O-methyltransferase
MVEFVQARKEMVSRQVAGRGITEPALLEAMRTVPREAFVPPDMREFAYQDSPLPIESEQTISQPYIVAQMIDAAGIRAGDRVLEVGAGSGYAAAVMGQIADEVFAIERHGELAGLAASRMERLGYDNVHIRHGDGTRGWADAAPFDAILVAARGAEIPQALKDQLAVGGRLIIPVGGEDVQSLQQLVKKPDGGFEEKDLGAVRFVPLIAGTPVSKPDRSLSELIAECAEPLPPIDDPAFGAAFDRFGDRRVVLIGEASHGTSEFYRARAAITKRLIEEHGFTIVAAEADWPDAATVNRHVRHLPPREASRHAFRRFPTWMWRNREVAEFVHWLRERNAGRDHGEQAGFYGLDLYNMNASIRAVIDYLDRVDPEAAAVARERYGCLMPWVSDPATYGRMALSKGYAPCEHSVLAMLSDLLKRELDYTEKDGEAFLDAAQNARLVRNAEAYYRAMCYGAAESWNQRDTHMFETLRNLLNAEGPDAKAVVWAHNSHIGDARATEMGSVRGELNIGQLARQHFGDEAALIGLGTHEGRVAAASNWDGPIEIKDVLPSRDDSFERLMHDSGKDRFLLEFGDRCDDELREALNEPLLERFIGVIYRPETERWSHYSAASLSAQFDAYIWFDRTDAVTPVPTEIEAGPDDTFPFGL